ncbi:MAG: GNAT family N-acetyltransferase [Candidatus Altiarchaeota archaeon]|nr:GNAT family N-acetyltransferase [Candidatus Altiarchaeota archaeon]
MDHVKIRQLKNPKKLKQTLMNISKQSGGSPVGSKWLDRRIKTNVFFMAEQDEPVGFASICPDFKYDRTGTELDIITICQKSQRQGIGRLLLDKTIEFTQRLGKTKIYLFVSQKNIDALGFYEKMGFVEKGILKDRYGPGEHSLIMKKELEI